MTRRARSGSPHNKNHTDKNNSLPTLSTPGPHLRSPQRQLVSLAPNLSSLEAEKPFQNLLIEGPSSHAPPNLLRQARGSQRVPRGPILLFMPALRRFHCLTCLARFVLHPGAGGPSDPPAESHHSLSPLTQTPHLSPSCREGCSLVFSSHDPADCAAGPSVDFHPFILGVPAMISRIVEYILDHTAGLSSFSLRYCCHSSYNSFHT